MKIFCIGSNLESYIALNHLMDQGCKIHTLITLPPGTYPGVSDYYDLHDFCKEHKINVIATKNVNSPETVDQVKALEPDYLFTLGWSQIFKEDFLACFSGSIIGTHPSDLPFGRGRAPVAWTVLQDLRTSAVSFFKIDTGVDTGKIIFKKRFEIPEHSYAIDVYNVIAENLGKGFLEIYQLLTKGEQLPEQEQPEEGATHRGKRSPSDGLLDFTKGVEHNERLVRAVSFPYPGAYCYYKDMKIRFGKVKMEEGNHYFGTLGQIHKKGKGEILVQFSDGNLLVGRGR